MIYSYVQKARNSLKILKLALSRQIFIWIGDTYEYLSFQLASLLERKQVKLTVTNLYKQRVKLLTNSELNTGNLKKVINLYALPVLTYSFGLLK